VTGRRPGVTLFPVMPGIAQAPAAKPTTEALRDPLSGMAARFNLPFRWFARRYFRHLGLDPDTVARLRALEARGSVVYVMRYSSRLDYFLFNTLFSREGLRLSGFANGIRFWYYLPLADAVRALLRGRRAARGKTERERGREWARDLALAGESFFLFLRTARLRRRRHAGLEAREELDLLEDVVRAVWDSERPVHVVPLALFWRKGPRSQRRFLNLFYGAATRPSDLAKITAFFTTYRDLAVKVGEPIDLASFVEARRSQGEHVVARTVRRSILTFLWREEKVVEGPSLRPLHRVEEIVLREPRIQRAIAERAAERGVSESKARGDAEKMIREIAANMNSTFLAVLNVLVGAVVRRLFAKVEVSGLEKVAGYAKRHPIVLVPSHRSYFDFLLISIVFYNNYLIPPHIAARENMAFGPFGFLWRRAGAFFMRRSFDDPLYKEVFRGYVAYLVSEGITQEFFIEGGRSRTGKTLAPRLGILSWEVAAFLDTARRDLFFVPLAITYERLVEEGAMVDELEGAEKKDESMLGLVRARKYLQRRFGTVFLNFGEPISLASTLGPDSRRLASDEAAEERRAFVGRLGNRIAERINWAAVPNATAVAASALLGDRRRGLFRADLVARMQEILDLLRLQDVKLTDALERDEGRFDESIASMLRMDLAKSVEDPRGEILYYEDSKRRALDFYRNSIVHFLAAPSFLGRQLLSDPPPENVRRELAEWLELFYFEFFTPRGEVLAAHLDAFLDHFERFGWVERKDGALRATEKGAPVFRFLAEQTRGFVEAYYATCAAVTARVVGTESVSRKELVKAAGEQFERSKLLGEVARAEAHNPVTFSNALELLARQRILAPEGDGVVRGDAFGDLAALRERLATALAAR
jgi:glycerol-3-phosphate O-acyltransferase